MGHAGLQQQVQPIPHLPESVGCAALRVSCNANHGPSGIITHQCRSENQCKSLLGFCEDGVWGTLKSVLKIEFIIMKFFGVKGREHKRPSL